MEFPRKTDQLPGIFHKMPVETFFTNGTMIDTYFNFKRRMGQMRTRQGDVMVILSVVFEIIVGVVIIVFFQEIGKRVRTNQYGSRYVQLDGITFDSNREASRYLALKEMQSEGTIDCLEPHKKFVLQEGFRDRHGEYHRPVTYSPDFVYLENATGLWVAEDVKSEATVRDDVWMLKKKLFLYLYGKDYDFRVVG